MPVHFPESEDLPVFISLHQFDYALIWFSQRKTDESPVGGKANATY